MQDQSSRIYSYSGMPNLVLGVLLPRLTSIRVSLFYLVGLFDLWVGIRTLLVSSVGAYLIASRIRGPYMPWIGFVFLMGHMSINHIFRQRRAAPDVVDITGKHDRSRSKLHLIFFLGAQMVLVMKVK